MEFKILQNFRGKAFGEEALVGLLSRCEMDYLYNKVRVDNTSAIKVLTRLGFTEEKTKDQSSIKLSINSLEKIKELGRIS